jgi:hypothetical protein
VIRPRQDLSAGLAGTSELHCGLVSWGSACLPQRAVSPLPWEFAAPVLLPNKTSWILWAVLLHNRPCEALSVCLQGPCKARGVRASPGVVPRRPHAAAARGCGCAARRTRRRPRARARQRHQRPAGRAHCRAAVARCVCATRRHDSSRTLRRESHRALRCIGRAVCPLHSVDRFGGCTIWIEAMHSADRQLQASGRMDVLLPPRFR